MLQESNEEEFVLKTDFPAVVKSKYYIDKTLLMKTFVANIDNANDFVTAPQNFGKSLNLQMMKHFLEIQVDTNGREIVNKRCV